MPKQLSEAAAWRKLAEWCVRKGRFLCIATREWSHGDTYYAGPAPFGAPWRAMCTRICHHAELGTYDDERDVWTNYDEPFSSNPNNDARVMFCLLMANECEEEAK